MTARKIDPMPARNFDPTSVPGLSAETRKAVNAVFHAPGGLQRTAARRMLHKSSKRWLRLPGHWDGRSRSSIRRACK